MAITDTSQEQPQPKQPSASNRTQSSPAPKQSWSFYDQSAQSAIPRTLGAESFNAIKKTMQELYKDPIDTVEIEVLGIDNQIYVGFAFSAIVVVTKYKNEPQFGLAYHILIIESTGKELPVITENINNRTVEIINTTSAALDSIMLNEVIKLISESNIAAGVSEDKFYFADGTVVPSTFNPEDKQVALALAYNSVNANFVKMKQVAGREIMNLATLEDMKDSNFGIEFTVGEVITHNIFGRPVRSDAQIALNLRRIKGHSTNSVNEGNQAVTISHVDGFVDILYMDQQGSQTNQFAQFNQQQQNLPKPYAANFVITSIMETDRTTTESILLTLQTINPLAQNNNWMFAFRPTPTDPNDIDIKDIGAINYDAQLIVESNKPVEAIDVKSSNFTTHNLGQLLSSLFADGLIVSMDCEEAGPQTWMTSSFEASRDVNSQAYGEVYQAAMNLTNNLFERYFPVGTPIIRNDNNIVHMGTWVDKKGRTRDIRDIDYLAVCNLVGALNPSQIIKWSDTYNQTAYDIYLRLDERVRMLRELTNNTMRITGYARRITFTSSFLAALTAANSELGINFNFAAPATAGSLTQQRGYFRDASNSLLTFNTPVYGAAGNIGQPGSRFARSSMNRYTV